MKIKDYQKYCEDKLNNIYKEVKTEWNSFGFSNNQYSPRLDLAVGPFAINESFGVKYDLLMNEEKSKLFIDKLIEENDRNVKEFGIGSVFSLSNNINFNSRCFISIEIENKVSRKHILGGLINASSLGRLAVLVAWTPDKLKHFIKLKNYLNFLSSVKKNSFVTDNILIVSKEQFANVLNLF